MYHYLINQDSPFMNKIIWKLKLPLQIEIFLWSLQRGVILTKDSLAKEIGMGVKSVGFTISMKQLNTSSLIAIMLRLSGV